MVPLLLSSLSAETVSELSIILSLVLEGFYTGVRLAKSIQLPLLKRFHEEDGMLEGLFKGVWKETANEVCEVSW